MTAADTYPSITVVAGPIHYSGPGLLGHRLRMGDGGAYITITDDLVQQWIQTLTEINEEKSN